MRFILDTNILIELSSFNSFILDKMILLTGSIQISIVTHIELLSGLHSDDDDYDIKALRIATLLEDLTILPFDADCARAYEAIVHATSFSRRKILDRMIAAQALAADATMITLNPDDFKDIPNLKLIGW